MDSLALTAEALREPWRLWTGHLVHYGWAHALANAFALAVPLLLVQGRDRIRLLRVVLVAAPLLSLLLLADPALGQYRGASGLACVLWAWVGIRLSFRRHSAAIALMLLGGLLLKLCAEASLGGGVMGVPEGWQSLPAAHFGGALLGLAFALPVQPHTSLA